MSEVKTLDTKAIASLKYTKEVKVDDVVYTLQKLPVRPALEIRQRCKVDGDMDDPSFYEELLENVVITPKMKLDDFDDVFHLEKLMQEVILYQYKGK